MSRPLRRVWRLHPQRWTPRQRARHKRAQRSSADVRSYPAYALASRSIGDAAVVDIDPRLIRSLGCAFCPSVTDRPVLSAQTRALGIRLTSVTAIAQRHLHFVVCPDIWGEGHDVIVQVVIGSGIANASRVSRLFP